MKKILCIPLLCCCCLYSASSLDSTSVSSKSASYDGSALVLSGQVLLDHGLGKMSAEEAVLERQETGKDFPFTLIHLNKGVLVSLIEQGELRCEKADLDFVALKGWLFAKEGEKVVYSDTLKKKKGEAASFRLMSTLLELGMSKKEQEGKKAGFEIDAVLAKDDVIIDYAKNFTLHADRAIYRKQASTSKEFQGMISAYPKDATSKCRLLHEEDKINAEAIDIDLLRSRVIMHHPEGALLSRFAPHSQKEEMHFSADHLTWDHTKNTLVLKGHVLVQETGFGELRAENELQIVQAQHKDKRIIKTLSTKGKISLLYGENQQLLSYGSLLLDQEHLTLSIDSPEIEGNASQNQQIYYEEERASVYADKALLEYSFVEEKLCPTTLTLRGNIRLFSKDPKQPKRCALADRLSYSPSTQTLILAADPNKKVLFWDEEEHLRLSGSEIHITKDPLSGKDLVKGIGKVQFTLSVEDASRFKSAFPFYKEQEHE